MSSLMTSVSETMDDIACALGDVTFTVSGEIAEQVNTIIHKVQVEELERLRKKEAAEKEAAAKDREAYLAGIQPQASSGQAQELNPSLDKTEVQQQCSSDLAQDVEVILDNAEIQPKASSGLAQDIKVNLDEPELGLDKAKVQPQLSFSIAQEPEIYIGMAENQPQASGLAQDFEVGLDKADVRPQLSFSIDQESEIFMGKAENKPQASLSIGQEPKISQASSGLAQDPETYTDKTEIEPQASPGLARDSEAYTTDYCTGSSLSTETFSTESDLSQTPDTLRGNQKHSKTSMDSIPGQQKSELKSRGQGESVKPQDSQQKGILQKIKSSLAFKPSSKRDRCKRESKKKGEKLKLSHLLWSVLSSIMLYPSIILGCCFLPFSYLEASGAPLSTGFGSHGTLLLFLNVRP